MKNLPLIALVSLIAASPAYSESDAEIIERVRAGVTEVFLEQVTITFPASFLESELPPWEKQRITNQLANDTANCYEFAIVEYAALFDVPISDLVSDDGSIRFDGDSGKVFGELLVPCIDSAWEAAGISRK